MNVHSILVLGLALGVGRAEAKPGGCHARPAIEAHPVTATAAERLRRMPTTTRGARADEYLLGDGRVLVQADAGGPGAVYTVEANRLRRGQLDEDLRMRRVAEGDWYHVLRGLIDDGETFASRAAQLAADFKRRLAAEGLPANADGADRLVARWREANCRRDPSLFRELTAWAGELAAARAAGRWSTRAGAGGVVEPVVEVAIGGETRELLPWQWADALLDGRASDLEPLVADALTAPAPRPVATSAAALPRATATVEKHAVPEAPEPSPDAIRLNDPGF